MPPLDDVMNSFSDSPPVEPDPGVYNTLSDKHKQNYWRAFSDKRGVCSDLNIASERECELFETDPERSTRESTAELESEVYDEDSWGSVDLDEHERRADVRKRKRKRNNITYNDGIYVEENNYYDIKPWSVDDALDGGKDPRSMDPLDKQRYENRNDQDANTVRGYGSGGSDQSSDQKYPDGMYSDVRISDTEGLGNGNAGNEDNSDGQRDDHETARTNADVGKSPGRYNSQMGNTASETNDYGEDSLGLLDPNGYEQHTNDRRGDNKTDQIQSTSHGWYQMAPDGTKYDIKPLSDDTGLNADEGSWPIDHLDEQGHKNSTEQDANTRCVDGVCNWMGYDSDTDRSSDLKYPNGMHSDVDFPGTEWLDTEKKYTGDDSNSDRQTGDNNSTKTDTDGDKPSHPYKTRIARAASEMEWSDGDENTDNDSHNEEVGYHGNSARTDPDGNDSDQPSIYDHPEAEVGRPGDSGNLKKDSRDGEGDATVYDDHESIVGGVPANPQLGDQDSASKQLWQENDNTNGPPKTSPPAPKNETPWSSRVDNHSGTTAYDNHEPTVDPQQLSANPQRGASGESGPMGDRLHRGFATISSPSTASTAQTFLNQQ